MKARLPLLLLPFVLVLGGAVLLRRDPRERNLQVLPADMVRTRIARSDGLTDGFPDRLVKRLPPEGTIPRDGVLEEFGPSLEEAKRAGETLASPIPKSPAALARGAAVFGRTCACCHGTGGLGDAPVTKRGFPPPPSLLLPAAKALKDGEILHAITYGRKNMPPAAIQVEPDDRWRVIQYLRSLQEPPR